MATLLARSLPLVATNEPYFAALSDHEAHDALLCIADGSTTSQAGRRQLTADHRFKTRAEMRGLFADLPEALNHSVEIALRCNYRPTTRGPILPRFTTETGEQRDVKLKARIPVYFVYLTAWATPDGQAHFRHDIYRRQGAGVTTSAL